MIVYSWIQILPCPTLYKPPFKSNPIWFNKALTTVFVLLIEMIPNHDNRPLNLPYFLCLTDRRHNHITSILLLDRRLHPLLIILYQLITMPTLINIIHVPTPIRIVFAFCLHRCHPAHHRTIHLLHQHLARQRFTDGAPTVLVLLILGHIVIRIPMVFVFVHHLFYLCRNLIPTNPTTHASNHQQSIHNRSPSFGSKNINGSRP